MFQDPASHDVLPVNHSKYRGNPSRTAVPLRGHVRPFQKADRLALLKIASDTAFFGAPIECFLDDRRAFEDAFYAYYTDYEPQHAWVAALPEGETETVVGFLTGCTDPAQRARVLTRRIMPAVAKNLLRGKYRIGKLTWQYIFRGIVGVLGGAYPHVDEQHYPAHLHINLLPEARGLGLGRCLIETYLAQLRELHITGVHLETTSMNKAAIRLYEKVGFQRLATRRTNLWRGIVDEPVENIIYGMNFNRDQT